MRTEVAFDNVLDQMSRLNASSKNDGGSILKQVRIVSLHILPISSFTINLIFQAMQLRKSGLKRKKKR
jgi:hypothetical protein